MATTLEFQTKFKAAKQGFFDRDMIKAKMDQASIARLARFGGLVKIISERSIKDATSKKQTSRPGEPPRSHVGTLKKMILFYADTQRMSVVIGPTLSNRPSGAPKTLEYGGTVNVEGKTIFRKRAAGRDARTGRFVTQGTTKEILHGTRQIAARPYMHPAFDKALARVQDMWKNSLR